MEFPFPRVFKCFLIEYFIASTIEILHNQIMLAGESE